MSLPMRLQELWAARRPNRSGTGAARFRKLKLEMAVAALLAATLAAILFQDAILERPMVVTLEDMSRYEAYKYSDANQGGASQIEFAKANKLSWTCELRNQLAYPYCGYGIVFDSYHQYKGLDLSKFDSIELDLSYQGPARTLTLYLKNYDPRYSKVPRPETDKFNMIEFVVSPGRRPTIVPMKNLQVPAWWIEANKIPSELQGPQVDNVMSLEIVASSGSPIGRYEQTLHSITFNRWLVPKAQYHAAIAAAWALLIAAFLIHYRMQELQARKAREKNWQKTLDSIPQMVWSATADGDEYINGQWAEFTGLDLGGESKLRRIELLHPEDRDRVWARWTHSLETGEPYECEYRLLHRSGEYRWILSRGTPQEVPGFGTRWYGTGTDIHDRVLAAQALDASEGLNRGIIEALPDRVTLLDLDGRCIFANRPARASGDGTFADRDECDELFSAIPDEARPRVVTAFNRARSGLIGRLTVHTADARWWDMVLAPVLDASGHPYRIVMASRDVTEQKAAEEKAHWNASHDGLTRLANRMALQKRVDEAIAEGAGFALLLLDVDDFKLINDTAGHDAGDALLCAFGQRLLEAAGPSDTVARLGGDEFAMILTGLGSEEELRAALDRIMLLLREPCIHNGRVFDCRASIGVSLFPEDGMTRPRLLKNADVALYAAKKAGKGNFQLFKARMRTELQKRGTMTSMAREALQHDRVMPYYQPKLDLRSGRLDGFEALLRWHHPKKGILNPADIAAAFEDLTLAAQMSDAIIEGVIRDILRWRDEGIAFGHVAINAAAAELRRDDFADRLLERLEAKSIPANMIQVEVTETVFLGRGATCVERALKTLSKEGVQIALDDFGTGYASLAHLKQFPVDIIKIDRSFVRELQKQRDNAPIIDAVINLGRSLNIKVVAEGIETPIQHHFLVARGCDYGQGHLYSPAVPVAEAADFARSPKDLSQAAA